MTKKLYDQNSHQTETTAVVRACTPVKDKFEVLLDRTVLFPEGGGQPSDTGTIGDATVLHCREADGEVYHLVDRALDKGAEVAVVLDWPRRFDFMQQHTGEHLLSFAFYKLFSAANVGFHLASDYATIDFDKPLDHTQIIEAEMLANSYIWRNLPVTATFYETEDDIKDLPLRKHAEGLSAPIRIVAIEGADMCTCCAPHCKLTGEIGSIFILEAASYKGGTRITFLCGDRALKHCRTAHDRLDTLARRFSTARDNTVSAVAKLSDEYGALKKRERDLVRELNHYIAAELDGSAETTGKLRLIVKLFSGFDAGRLKDLAQSVAEEKTLVVLFSKNDEKLNYVLACGEAFPVDLSEVVQAVNTATNGKGGGRGTLAQGMAKSSAGAEGTVEQLRDYLIRRLRQA
jgi:alanyl-tRNA synthetase